MTQFCLNARLHAIGSSPVQKEPGLYLRIQGRSKQRQARSNGANRSEEPALLSERGCISYALNADVAEIRGQSSPRALAEVIRGSSAQIQKPEVNGQAESKRTGGVVVKSGLHSAKFANSTWRRECSEHSGRCTATGPPAFLSFSLKFALSPDFVRSSRQSLEKSIFTAPPSL
ncbi:hypothetical protein C8R44DRAFT_736352 [Mycena epipterygia]|nr:hypothetical protein C8R44DRAFT_736352 [Mycena epipterygia]